MMPPSPKSLPNIHCALAKVVVLVVFLTFSVGAVKVEAFTLLSTCTRPVSGTSTSTSTAPAAFTSMNSDVAVRRNRNRGGHAALCGYRSSARPVVDDLDYLVLDWAETESDRLTGSSASASSLVEVPEEATEETAGEASVATLPAPPSPSGHDPPSVGARISRALVGRRCPLVERLGAFFLVARSLLETTGLAEDALDRLRRHAGLDVAATSRIAGHVVGPDHLGTLVPPGVGAEAIVALAGRAGFNQRVVRCPSTVVARELGSKCGRETVPTELVKASGIMSTGRRGGVEVFLPDVDRALAERWIAEARDYHLALRVKTRESVLAIHDELRAVGYPLPDFMKGRPMENEVERVLLIYVDLPDGRLEFIHYEEEVTPPPRPPRPSSSLPRRF